MVVFGLPVPEYRARIALLLVLMPMLTLLGHWPGQIPIPGTDYVVGVPSSGHTHASSAREDDHHGRHCHEGMATCSDVPAGAGAAFALLAAEVQAIGLTGASFAMPRSEWTAPTALPFRVETPPPRS